MDLNFKWSSNGTRSTVPLCPESSTDLFGAASVVTLSFFHPCAQDKSRISKKGMLRTESAAKHLQLPHISPLLLILKISPSSLALSQNFFCMNDICNSSVRCDYVTLSSAERRKEPSSKANTSLLLAANSL